MAIHTARPSPRGATQYGELGKPQLFYFTVEDSEASHKMLFKQYLSKREARTARPMHTYALKKKIAAGAYGSVYAARSDDGHPRAIKVVEQVLGEAPADDTFAKEAAKNRVLASALEEAWLLQKSLENKAVIDFHCVGYTASEILEKGATRWLVRVVLVLELGTSLTLREFFPAHCMHRGIFAVGDTDLRKKFSLDVDTIVSVPNTSRQQAVPVYIPMLELSARILETVIELHRQSIVHRDCKPENFIFCRLEGEHAANSEDFAIALHNVYHERDAIEKILQNKDHQNSSEVTAEHRWHTLKLIDFGSALQCSHTTRETSITGTPQYASPEVAKAILGDSGQRRHARTKRELMQNDVWSVGITLLELMLGRTHLGLIEGILSGSGKAVPPSTQTKDTDRMILREIAGLTLPKIENYVYQSAKESTRAYQSTFDGHQPEDVLPKKWIRTVLSLVHPSSSRRGTLRSAHVTCRRLLMEARRILSRPARQFRKTSIPSEPPLVQTNTDTEGSVSSEADDVNESTREDLPITAKDVAPSRDEVDHVARASTGSSAVASRAPSPTIDPDFVSKAPDDDSPVPPRLSEDTSDVQSIDILEKNDEPPQNNTKRSGETSPGDLHLESVSAIFRDITVRSREHSPFDKQYPAESTTHTAVSENLHEAPDKNRFIEMHSEWSFCSELLKSSARRNTDHSVHSTVVYDAAPEHRTKTADAWSYSPVSKPRALSQAPIVSLTPQTNKLLTSVIYETFSRIPVVHRFEVPKQRAYVTEQTAAFENPPVKRTHACSQEEIAPYTGKYRTDDRENPKILQSNVVERTYKIERASPVKKLAKELSPMQALMEESPWVYISDRNSTATQPSTRLEQTPQVAKSAQKAAPSPPQVASWTLQTPARSPSTGSSVLTYVTPRFRKLQGIPDEDSWVMDTE